MDFLTSPGGGLIGLTLAAFLAATLVPFSSEAVLFAYLRLHPDEAALAITLATLGNTAGGMTTYLLGRLFPEKYKMNPATTRTLRKYGSISTFFAWLPLVGDGLCLAAGWLRVNWVACLAFMAAGRLARYVVIAAL
jgi:membrane protein YqaA with SNARE-associated domain